MSSDNIGSNPIIVKGAYLDLRQQVIRWVKKSMAKAGIETQRALAKATGLNYETINNLMLAKGDASDATLRRIADACDVPTPRVLLDETGLPRNHPIDLILIAQSTLGEALDLLIRPKEQRTDVVIADDAKQTGAAIDDALENEPVKTKPKRGKKGAA